MDLKTWTAYHEAKGVPRKRLLEKLMRAEEPLVRFLADKLIERTHYCVNSLRDDLLQAGRIGVLQAIDIWDPKKGRFTTIAGYKCLYEMQQVLRHATPISRPKDLGRGRIDLSYAKQAEAEAFYTRHGRAPEADELGLSKKKLASVERFKVSFTGDTEYLVDTSDQQSPEERIDNKRRLEKLVDFMFELSPKEQEALLSGKRLDLLERAKAAVEGA